MSTTAGVLYVVATPIGNLDDLSPRARQVLTTVDAILAEDTRTSKRLLHAFDIQGEVTAYHDHNERQRCEEVIGWLKLGRTVALISDAGTPLVSDPGYRLVGAAHASGITVIAVPGPSAVLAALSVSGLATDRFTFEGFVPSREGERQRYLQGLASEARTMVFFEAPHRVAATLSAMSSVFGAERRATIGRELTKRYEQTVTASLGELCAHLAAGSVPCRGEFVLVVAGTKEKQHGSEMPIDAWLKVLLTHLPPSTCAAIVAELTGLPRKQIYARTLAVRGQSLGEAQESDD